MSTPVRIAGALAKRVLAQLGEDPDAIPTRRSKHNVDLSPEGRALRTRDGVLYDSLAEAHYRDHLVLLHKAGQILSWQRQVKFVIVWPPTPDNPRPTFICDYLADFVVTLPPTDPRTSVTTDTTSATEIHEVKGHETAVWKLKRSLMAAAYPHIPLKVVRDVP